MPVLLTLLSTLAAAQPEAPSAPTIYPELGEESVLSGELGCADVVECPPRAGFVPFARLQLGQFWVEDEDDGQYVPQSAALNQTLVPSATQQPIANGSNIYIPFEDSSNLMIGWIDLSSPDGSEARNGFIQGDGIADDIDSDSQHGPSVVDLLDADGQPDNGLGIYPDFDDFAPLPAIFQQVKVREEVRVENLEFSLQHLYDNGWVNSRPAWRIGANGWGLNLDVGQLPMPSSASAPSDPNSGWLRRWLRGFNHAHYVAYGVRTVRLVDEFEIDLSGGTLNHANFQTEVDHINISPHLTLGRTSRSGRWLFDLSGTVLVGYGHARFEQDGVLGEVSPSAYNRPLNFNPIAVHNRASEDFLATYAELDFNTSYFLTSHWTIDLTARAFVLGEHFSAEDHVVWSLPNFGISDSTQSHSYAGGNLFVGASYVW
jgi:hypothetical protein